MKRAKLIETIGTAVGVVGFFLIVPGLMYSSTTATILAAIGILMLFAGLIAAGIARWWRWYSAKDQ
jgi:hypothetical protein